MPRRPSFARLRKERSKANTGDFSRVTTQHAAKLRVSRDDGSEQDSPSRRKSANDLQAAAAAESSPNLLVLQEIQEKPPPSPKRQADAPVQAPPTAKETQSPALTSLRTYPVPPQIAPPRFVTVNEACDELWQCGDPEQAATWLKHLHKAFLCTRLDAYDPSEAFVSLSGAALRFHGTSLSTMREDETPSSGSFDTDALWCVWEEALWAAAALARVCVGAAWRSQLRRRRAYILGRGTLDDSVSCVSGGTANSSPAATPARNSIAESKETNDSSPLEEVVAAEMTASHRSFSPMTASSFGNSRGDSFFPPIQERLPAAMLRFAASAIEAAVPPLAEFGEESEQKWRERRKSLAEAQRELVLALCYATPEEAPIDEADEENRPQWTILEAHGPIGNMVCFWFASCAPSLSRNSLASESREKSVDWACLLQVTRAAADLVSAGWHPAVTRGVAEELTDMLLAVSERGLTLSDDDLASDDELGTEGREEKFAASLCAVEALSVLASIGSSGQIPTECQERVVRSLCDLQVATTSSGMPGVFSGEEQVTPELRALRMNKESCHADMVDLLWVMLAHDSSAATALETLLDLANKSLTVEAIGSHDQNSDHEVNIKDTEMAIAQSTIAMKTLGAALWGKPPENPGIPDLRISWNSVLEALANTSHLLRSQMSSMAPDCLLYLLFNVVSALRKFADSELIQGDALILVDEWKPFVRAIRQGLDCWLDIRRVTDESEHQSVDPLCEHIRHETKLLVSRIGSFLNICSSQEDSSFHLIVDNNDLRDLYISLLRNAVPRLDPDRGTELALSVVRSWATLGFSPHQSEEWVQTASSLMKESFAVYDDTLGSETRCVHSPLVRLEALLSITYDEDECSLVLPKDTWTPAVSPFVLTRYEREQHIELVREVLPWVLRLFAKDAPGLDLPVHFTVTISSPQDKPEETAAKDTCDGNVTLRRFALCLIGRFVRSVFGEGRHRRLLLDILQAVALRQDFIDSDHAVTSRNESTVDDPPDKILMSLEAINQLELTLVAPFRAMPYNHATVRTIIGILCRIVEHGVNRDGDTKISGDKGEVLRWSRVVSFASLLVLCRLRMSHDGRLQLVDRDGVLQHVRDQLMFHLCGEDDDIDEGYLIAPFIRVCSSQDDSVRNFQSGRTSTDVTTVSFDVISETVINALHSSHSKTTFDDAGDFEARFRATCYDALSSFALSGIEITVSDKLTKCLLSPTEASDYVEVERLSQCRALSFISQRYVVMSLGFDDKDEVQDKGSKFQNLEAFVGHLLSFCCSRRELEVLAGCRAIRAVLYQLSRMGPDDGESTVLSRVSFQIIQRLKEEIAAKHVTDGMSADETAPDTIGDSLFSLVYSILTQSYYAGTVAAQTTRVLVAEVCLDFKGPYVLLSKAWRPLPIRCLSTALRRMADSDLEDVQAVNALGEDHRSSLMKDLVAQRRLQIRALASNTNQGPHCSTRHEKMTRENDDIARFAVQKEPKGGATPSATWLCGQSILTCRIGGSKSRYRGWLEVVVRSPTARSRRMIRLPNSVSLENPEFPSSLWTGPVTSTETAAKPSDKPQFTVPSDLYSDDTPVMNKARELIERWDAAYGPLPVPPPKRQEAFYQSVIPPNPMRPTKEPTADATAAEAGQSIRQWLTAALKGNSRFLDEVEQQFLSLGFSSESLGWNGTRLRLSGSSDFPDYLLPIQRLLDSPNVSRAVSILDRTSFLNTHKIALLFAGDAKKSISKSESTLEHVILSAKGASPAFFSFAREIGSMVMTRHLRYYSGGLDTSGDSDGKFAFIYLDSADANDPATTMVVYHCVALMPENINNRKRHVGNDNIHIVFVEKGSRLHGLIHGEGLDCETLSSSLVSGQFGFLTIFVLAMPDEGLLRVSVRLRKGLPGDSAVFLKQFVGDAMISRSAAPDYVRDIAIRADITCKSILEEHLGAPNWTERKRHISSMMRYCAQQSL